MKINIEAAENLGTTKIGSRFKDSAPPTIIVIGCGRGGTSAISTIINELEIFTGRNSTPPTYEDANLAHALESKDLNAARNIILDYNKKHNIWAYKRPSSIEFLETIHKTFINPAYIFIFRDPQSVAFRASQTEQTDHLDSIQKTLLNYQRAVDFIKKHNPTGLIISYEKTVLNPQNVIQQIAELAGVPTPSSETVKRIANKVIPSPEPYIENLRTTNFIAYIDEHSTQKLTGWAAIRNSTDPCILQLRDENRVISEHTANIRRPDVKSAGVHISEVCGFSIDIAKHPNPRKLKLYLKDTEIYINKNPTTSL